MTASPSDSETPIDVLVVGSSHMDLIARAPVLPDRGQSVLGSGYAFAPGGKAANQAIAAAQQGARTALVARLGRDALGDQLVAALSAKNVDIAFMVRANDGIPTGISPVLMSEEGEYVSIIVPSASAGLTPRHIVEASLLLQSCKVLMVQFEIGLAASTEAALGAAIAGATVLLNASPVTKTRVETSHELWGAVDVLVLNEDEARWLSGQEADTPETALLAIATIRSCYAIPTVIVTLGRHGAAVGADDGPFVVSAYNVPVLDTLGAGDVFAGAVAAALARKLPLVTAVEWGMAAGALAVQRLGAYDAAPTNQQTATLLASRSR